MKETILLPQTDFPMKGNLPEREPHTVARWKSIDLHGQWMKNRASAKKFVMPDGPPYANGSIHIGHALNKCLKDFVIKYKNMAGFKAAFIPGWDCHGLPIEHKVTKDLGAKRKDKTHAEIRTLCRQEASKWVKHQAEQFQRLGVVADWDRPYLTMDPSYEAEEVRALATALRRGTLFRGEKPVYWCPTLQTALAEAEVEYHEHTSPSIYFAMEFRSFSESLPKAFDGTVQAIRSHFAKESLPSVAFAVWTTTPWTLPANLGLALNADLEYGFFAVEHEGKDRVLIFAKGLEDSFADATGLKPILIGPTVQGRHFERLNAKHPFYDRSSLIVLGDHVQLEATGTVHTAPGHGQEDYSVGLKYGLGVLSPVDAEGRYTDEVPEYKGQKIFDANPLIVERLRSIGGLLAFKEFRHQYPHNWRSKTPLIFRATPQWFLGMDLDEPAEASHMRSKALKAVESIQFVPEWGRPRLEAMIQNRPDWCLSRQRIWGVPIPVFHCKSCGEVLANADVMDRVADAIEAEGGIEAYHAHPESDFTRDRSGEPLSCQSCGAAEFARGQDILDVWFDSGVCFRAVQQKREHLDFPADIYLEGSDQHRGWFQTSLLASMATTGSPPFKALLTHGFVNDPQGRKMSKSLGNVVDPQEVIKKSGAEIIRLWAASVDYGQDVGCGPQSFERVTEMYRRYRNSLRFILGNLKGFDPSLHTVPYSQMQPLDRWALSRLNELIARARAGYDAFEFHKVSQSMNQFFTVDMSAGYMDMIKDRLYTWREDGRERRSAQTALYLIALTTVKVMAPIASFLAEEVYGHLPGDRLDSVLLEDFPSENSEWKDRKLDSDFEQLMSVRALVTKELEGLRQTKEIGSSLDARVEIQASGDTHELFRRHSDWMCEFFIVSQFQLTQPTAGTDANPASPVIRVGHATGSKCERCWYWSDWIGTDKSHPTVCEKCSRALS